MKKKMVTMWGDGYVSLTWLWQLFYNVVFQNIKLYTLNIYSFYF